jgi:hypothetical protein
MHVNYNELQHGFDIIPTMQQTKEHKLRPYTKILNILSL